MPEIGTSGLMSGDGKRSVGHRPQATAPILDSTRSRTAVRLLPSHGRCTFNYGSSLASGGRLTASPRRCVSPFRLKSFPARDRRSPERCRAPWRSPLALPGRLAFQHQPVPLGFLTGIAGGRPALMLSLSLSALMHLSMSTCASGSAAFQRRSAHASAVLPSLQHPAFRSTARAVSSGRDQSTAARS
jgi:hypothetical protein